MSEPLTRRHPSVERMMELEAEIERLTAALRDLIENVGGHAHWDKRGTHGVNCLTCQRQGEAVDRARAVLEGKC